MKKGFTVNLLILFIFLIVFSFKISASDSSDGFWPPHMISGDLLTKIKEQYEVELNAAQIATMQAAAVTLGGGSGVFISPRGLISTNFHVASSFIDAIPDLGHALHENGYKNTADAASDIPLVGLEVLRLVRVVDLSNEFAQITDPSEKKKRQIELEHRLTSPTQKAQVIELYQGAKNFLYIYERYDDIRLVFNPAQALAELGGDVANFDFPRYALDFTFLRAYRNGKPIDSSAHHIPFSLEPVQENEFTMILGTPGLTQRNELSPVLAYNRDIHHPLHLELLNATKRGILKYRKDDPSETKSRITKSVSRLEGVENYIHMQSDRLEVLRGNHSQIIADHQTQEASFLVNADEALQRSYEWLKQYYTPPSSPIEKSSRPFSAIKHFLFAKLPTSPLPALIGSTALTRIFGILLKQRQSSLPDEKRISGFESYASASLDQQLLGNFSHEAELEYEILLQTLPIYERYLEEIPALKLILMSDKEPKERALELSRSEFITRESRERLLADPKLAHESKDPLLVLARRLLPFYLAYTENSFEKKSREIQTLIHQHRLSSGEIYSPDGNSRTRFSFGKAKGFNKEERELPFQTTLGGLFDYVRSYAGTPDAPSFQLPSDTYDWENEADWDSYTNTPYNFSHTSPAINGNSGSGTFVIRNGKLFFVGNVFDINRLGQHHFYGFYHGDPDAKDVRSITVSAPMIHHLVNRQCPELLKELGLTSE